LFISLYIPLYFREFKFITKIVFEQLNIYYKYNKKSTILYYSQKFNFYVLKSSEEYSVTEYKVKQQLQKIENLRKLKFKKK